ncbi:hypothetical protein [Actinomadura keratinilytica]|jgi:hypothetical protein|uniref:Uncharacterized protein n=1 Tax=Actinomadura keratinilytica TaxID=547461 RepID=A0ABP7YPJ5_9ACTN
MSRVTKLAAITAVSAAAVALTATPAWADNWTNGPFTATANSSSLVVKVGGTTVATCSGSTLTGNMTDTGAFSVTGATATGCGVTVTPTGFPWSGSFTSGTTQINGFKMSALGCTYTGNLSGSYTEPAPPAIVTFTDQPVTGSGLFCVSNVTVSVTYVFTQP